MGNDFELFAILKHALVVSAVSSEHIEGSRWAADLHIQPKGLKADLFNRFKFGIGIRISSSAILPLTKRKNSLWLGVREGSTVAVFNFARVVREDIL